MAVLGTWALVVNGTFFAAMSLRTRSREIMLPLLLFPISDPGRYWPWWKRDHDPVVTGEDVGQVLDRIACSPMMWCLLLSVWLLFEKVLHAE